MNRLLSLDILRGLTVFGMILVNNGAGHEHFYPLTHSAWNGLTPCDLVFPFFLFMVGVSIPMSSRTDLRRVLWRSIKMFALGVALHAWDMWIGGKDDILANLRIWGVLERIALCYLAVSVYQYYARKHDWSVKVLWTTIITLLIGYAILLLVGNGYAQDETNLACIIDRALVGEAHLYHKSPIDPEGLLGTLPSIAHTMIGVYVGLVVKQKISVNERLLQLFTLASLLLIVGFLLSFGFPLNKRIWSPSYVLVTCGLAAALLALLIRFVDNPELSISNSHSSPFTLHSSLFTLHSSLFTFPSSLFKCFGLNAIALYVLSEALSPVFWHFNLGGIMTDYLLSIGFTPQFASLSYALSFDALMALIAVVMYKAKIFIKL